MELLGFGIYLCMILLYLIGMSKFRFAMDLGRGLYERQMTAICVRILRSMRQ